MRTPQFLDTIIGNGVGIYKDALVTYASDGQYRGRTSLSQGQGVSLMSNYEAPLYGQSQTSWQHWGFDDNFPAHVLALLERNPIAEGIMRKIVDFIAGKDLVLYRKKVVDGKLQIEYVQNEDIQAFLDLSDAHAQIQRMAYDLILTGNAFYQLVKSNSGGVSNFAHTDATVCRIGDFYVEPINFKLGDFTSWGFFGIVGKSDVLTLPAFRGGKGFEISPIVMDMVKMYRPGAYRYGKPFWAGAENFIRLMNEIPVFHLAGLRNGYGLRWHIKIPDDYFQQFDEEAAMRAEQDLRDGMDKWLAGAENQGKAFVSRFRTDALGKMKDGIIFEPLQPELFDNAFATIFEQSMVAVCSALGINPELAGVVLQGGMSGNSGSGIRNAHNEYVNLTVPSFRRILLKPFEQAKRLNNWPTDVYLGMIDHTIEKLDENPTAGSDGLPSVKPDSLT